MKFGLFCDKIDVFFERNQTVFKIDLGDNFSVESVSNDIIP